YLSGPGGRSAAAAAARLLPFVAPWFRAVRRLFKAAEMRPDPALFGVLARRFEEIPHAATRSRWSDHVSHPTLGWVRASHPEIVWTSATRGWFRRRVWRTLRRLGEAKLLREYAELATGL